MALTVSQQPQLYTPAYNAQTFVALSNQIAVTDFKYIVTVEINGSGVLKTYDILQRPDGYLVFDPQEWVKNYIDRSYFNPKIYLSTYYAAATGKYATVQVKIKEYYSAAIQSTTTINYTAWDACLNKEDFENYNYSSYIDNGGLIIPLDGQGPIDARISINNGSHFIHYFQLTSRKIVCELFSKTAVSYGSFTINYSAGSGMLYADLGAGTCIMNGYTPIDGDYLVYEIKDVSNNVLMSNTITFYDISTNHKEHCLYFLTRSGKIEHFNFELLSQENINKKTNSVRLNPSKLRSGVYSSYKYDREVFNVSTIETKTITLNTNWITETQSNKLQELWDSPIIFLHILYDNKIFAVNINTPTYKVYKHINEPLFNYTVECEYSIQEQRQRAI